MNLKFFRQIFKKIHVNPFSGSGIVWGQTDGGVDR